jgi:hypothetical protein
MEKLLSHTSGDKPTVRNVTCTPNLDDTNESKTDSGTSHTVRFDFEEEDDDDLNDFKSIENIAGDDFELNNIRWEHSTDDNTSDSFVAEYTSKGKKSIDEVENGVNDLLSALGMLVSYVTVGDEEKPESVEEDKKEGDEEFRGVKYTIYHNIPKGYWASSQPEGAEIVEKQYFDKYDNAKEHAELEIDGYLGEDTNEGKKENKAEVSKADIIQLEDELEPFIAKYAVSTPYVDKYGSGPDKYIVPFNKDDAGMRKKMIDEIGKAKHDSALSKQLSCIDSTKGILVFHIPDAKIK